MAVVRATTRLGRDALSKLMVAVMQLSPRARDRRRAEEGPAVALASGGSVGGRVLAGRLRELTAAMAHKFTLVCKGT